MTRKSQGPNRPGGRNWWQYILFPKNHHKKGAAEQPGKPREGRTIKKGKDKK